MNKTSHQQIAIYGKISNPWTLIFNPFKTPRKLSYINISDTVVLLIVAYFSSPAYFTPTPLIFIHVPGGVRHIFVNSFPSSRNKELYLSIHNNDFFFYLKQLSGRTVNSSFAPTFLCCDNL